MSRVATLSIGDEVLEGRISDTNGAWLARSLQAMGLEVIEHAVVGDDRQVIVDAVGRMSHVADHVITTGGIGPTPDDLTRFAAADLLGEQELVEDVAARSAIEAWCAQRALPMSEARTVLAQRPEGASFMSNAFGTAPGLSFAVGDARIWVLPGPPGEMKPMFEAHVAGSLAGTPRASGEVCAVGLTEVQAAELLGTQLEGTDELRVGIRVGSGVVRVAVDDRRGRAGQTSVTDALDDVRRALNPWALPPGVTTPAEALGRALHRRDGLLATAESCTGGGIGQAVTSLAGSSAWYVGGWVTYCNMLKIELLDVPPSLLDAQGPGAVSPEVAEAMAWGARTRSGATCAVSVTGIAGPDGGSEDKPVGTVWMGLADDDGSAVRCIHVPGDRAQVRQGTILAALQWARWRTIGEDARLCWDVRS